MVHLCLAFHRILALLYEARRWPVALHAELRYGGCDEEADREPDSVQR